MGVTLERVQFKFASIIGELCSEPDVLSQFAVWVDLRLAEYKLKGSISLDCSGDTPDPVWLKGILSALLAKRLAKQKLKAAAQIQRIPTPPRTNVRKTPPVSNFPRHREERQIVTVSPEPVIKEEPSDDLFPVSLHSNKTDNLGNGAKSDVRKRSATDFTSSPSQKERRLDTPEDVQPSNESLMSIIGGEEEDLTAEASNSSSYANNSGTDYNIAAEIAENAQKQIDAAITLGDGYMGSGEVIPTAGTSESTHSDLTVCGGEWMGDISIIVNDSFGGTGEKPDRTQRTLRKTRGHVNIFQSWLLNRPSPDGRNMEDIAPNELDPILEDFFQTVRSKTGAEYGHNSLRSLRDSLERHLKDKFYPESIIVSPLFARSQAAYKQKLFESKHQTNLT